MYVTLGCITPGLLLSLRVVEVHMQVCFVSSRLYAVLRIS